ncbi:type I polyketide synthase [Streptomyces milbemycinicus]|uniref:type I polyketide synthase n=1 Tax=Streptomyces milbemycinicus TaxID=476552 RepID=UPI00340D524F
MANANEEKLRDYLKRATAELVQVRRRLAEIEAGEQEPIAVVGMACRFPGGVGSPAEFWELLASDGDAISGFPVDRGWNVEALYDPNPDRARTGTSYTRHGGFLHDAADFDAGFFGISPREALAMDPQQRLLLETSWEALEGAGIDPATLRGSRTGVFAGMMYHDYATRLLELPDGLEGLVGNGNAGGVLSGRLAYSFGFEGPAVTVDTACSSSLVALHLACQSLRSGECSLALAGGVTVMSTPGVFVEFSRQRGLAADGRCKPYAAAADGVGMSEGVAVLLVERLSDARRLGHRVLAVVRGSAVNQDGASNGLTAPNGPSQQRVIRQALAGAGLAASDVDVVEGHGTGTTLGDPIEAQAILATYGQDRPEDRPLWLGSVKSNIGHTQAAAGVAGVIKMVLALAHGTLPRSLHVDAPTPHVDWSAGRVRLLNESVPWPGNGRPRRAGVSSFGVSGTNAHIILEQAPDQVAAESEPTDESPVVPCVISARSEGALRGQARRLREFVAGRDELRGVARALAGERSVFERRAVIVAEDRDELVRGLDALATGAPAPQLVERLTQPGDTDEPVVAVLFTGQGAQRVGMGRELYAAFPAFAAAFDAVCAELTMAGGPDVRKLLLADADASTSASASASEGCERTEFAQPALFALEVALYRLVETAGIRPRFLLGHSVGELVAAHVAGVLSLPDAARLVVSRGRLMQALPAGGAMAAMEISEREAGRLLAEAETGSPEAAQVSLAAVNGPRSVVLSGDEDAVRELAGRCAERGHRTRRLRVSHAFHSPRMDAMLEEFRREAERVTYHPARIPVVSNVTGAPLPAEEFGAPEYWVRHVRAAVRFGDGVAWLRDQGVRTFLELGPDGTLCGLVQDVFAAEVPGADIEDAVLAAALRPDRGESQTYLAALARLFVSGVEVDWPGAMGWMPGAVGGVELPTYAFERERYWLEAAGSDGSGAGGGEGPLWEAVERGDVPRVGELLGVGEAAGLATLVPALGAWWRGCRDRGVLDGWRYREAWRPVGDGGPGAPTGRWLVVAADGVDGSLVVEELERSGARAALHAAEGCVAREALVERLRAELGPEPEVDGVALLLAGSGGGPGAGALLLVWLQALGDVGVAARLWCVTRGAVSVGGGDAVVSPGLGQVWGLGRVAALEAPEVWGGLVDVPDPLDARAARSLVRALAGPERECAVRASGVFVRRLERAPLAGAGAEPGREWRPHGTVLITGGTGGLGAQVARWLAGRGPVHLLLLSRRGEAAEGAAGLRDELAGLGARVTVAACDVADRDALTRVLAGVPEDAPLTAVVHAAGALDDAVLATLTPERLEAARQAKAVGAWQLHELTRGADLTAFVVFSSAAATFGSAGQGGYAAANAEVDALIQHRRGLGLPGLSVAWGAWAGGGMADAAADAGRLRRHGMAAMDPRLALTALGHALEHDETCLTVADIDWRAFVDNAPATGLDPLISGIPEARTAWDAAGQGAAEAAGTLRARLAGLAADEQRRMVVELVRTHAAAVLGHAGPAAVPPERAFRELGFDSLTAVELRNRLNAATGLRLPATAVFDYPHPAALAQHTYEQLFGAPGTAGGPSSADLRPMATDEPIAVVGMACRLPGGVRSAEEFWELLAQGRDAIAGFPMDRGWGGAALYDADPERPGTSYARAGGFLYDAADFDAGFFGISPREALAMDPQQRLLLETSWETFEKAGLDPADLRGSRTGAFVGMAQQDYVDLLRHTGEDLEGYAMTGVSGSALSGRLAYSFGFEGPAVTVDTACSSSLVALHLACQSLRSGECSLALAGGVTVMSTPGVFVEFSRQRGLAADGRCKPYAAAADGVGWSEGVGMLLVERLSDARRLGHRVLAVVRGSAVNQDGASNGLTAPNGPSQQRVIRQALAGAGLAASDVDVVEGHGTGTTLGDPIEAQAILATYGQDRPEDRPLWLGSVKSNIGHTQAAAGVAGVIKMVLSLQHDLLPPSLHTNTPTPHVDWSAGRVRLLSESVPWPGNGRPRRAGVSSFGVSGTNAHIILEQAPDEAVAESESTDESPVVPWVVSARSEGALRGQARRLREFVAGRDELRGVARALAGERSVFERRAVIVAEDRDELVRGLDALATGAPAAGLVEGPPAPAVHGKVAMLFGGQGTQWEGMAAELLDTAPAFADQMAACAEALAPHVDWSLTDVVRGEPDAPPLDRADVVQPVLFAVMVSLAALWRSYGVRPDAVAGHSQGEIAAAYVAGALSLEDAARIVALRSQALSALAGRGAMLSVGMPAPELEPRLAPWAGRLCVAADNGAGSAVVSGTPEAVDALLAELAADGVRARKLNVDWASHSPQVEAIHERLLTLLAPIRPRTGDIPLYSTVTGERMDGGGFDAEYWYRNLRQMVRFQDTTRALVEDGHTVFIESGPHPAVSVGVQETLDALGATDALVLGTLRRGEGGLSRFLTSVARLFVSGGAVDWSSAVGSAAGRRGSVELPTYAFERHRFWLEPAPAVGGGVAQVADEPLWAAVRRGDVAGVGRLLGVGEGASLEVLVPALEAWRQRCHDRESVDGLRYREVWRPAGVGGAGALMGRWLVVAADGARQAVVEGLERAGARVVRVSPESGSDDYAVLVERLRAESEPEPAVTGLVLVVDDEASESLQRALVQALSAMDAGARLWCVTSGAVSLDCDDEPGSPASARAWDVARRVRLEAPERWGGLVDVAGAPDRRVVDGLIGVLHGDERECAVRTSGVFVRRVVRAPLAGAVAERAWRPEGTVLIDGGALGPGPHTARWLAARGAEHLLLLDENGDGFGIVDELSEAGVRVTTAACDPADRQALAQLLTAIPEEYPLRAVVHTAQGDDGIAGAWNLHELTRDTDLSAFVVFSSAAPLLGAPGHGACAEAAALVQHRRGLGLPGLSMTWGPWAVDGAGETGTAGAEAARPRSGRGVAAMDPRLALEALGQALDRGETCLTVADIDWPHLVETATEAGLDPLISEIPEAREAWQLVRGDAGREPDGALRARLAGLAADERLRALVELVRTHAAAVLGHDGPAAVEPERAFRELGFDSLTAVELRNRLNIATGLPLPATVVFDHPNPAALARGVRELLFGGGTATGSAVSLVRETAGTDEPIAVVGMACRFPGGVRSAEEFWQLLTSGKDAIAEFPADRGWDVETLYDPDPERPGTSYTRAGGFLYDAADFDAGFFGISPREALAMDPQQRLLLETSWEALERAGIDPRSLGGSRTGVFAGLALQDYAEVVRQGGPELAGYALTGISGSVLSGRLAYTFGFEGPAVTVDTACSSSLVALHLACQSLRSGESSLALAGGATVMSTPAAFLEFSRQRGLAADGRCKAYAAAADGVGWSEGAGVLLLARLSDARRLGHRVLAVVRGSAVNQDGASNGLTAPNGPAQQRVIRQALANADVPATGVDAVEGHGTGTTLGDPIEAQAILATYGQDRPEDRPLWLGSVKSNIGHTQAAAGVAGLIKMVLALQHDLLPPSLYTDDPSPHVDWSSGHVRLLTEPVPWPRNGHPRRAGISSFGVSGTNAHVILEQAPEEPGPESVPEDEDRNEDRNEERDEGQAAAVSTVVPWVVSARSEGALRGQAHRLREFAAEEENLRPVEVARALVTERAVFERRAVVVAEDREGFVRGLDALAAGVSATGLVAGAPRPGTDAGLALLFAGQGTQRTGMGLELAASFPAYAHALDTVVTELDTRLDRPLRPLLFAASGTDEAALLDRTRYAQPALFAVEVALFRLLESFGVRPDFLVGHSLGELTAAHAAGVLTLRDAALLVAARGRLMEQLPPGGAMVALWATEDEVAEALAGREALVSVAAVNGPRAVVVSGERSAVDDVAAAFTARGRKTRRLRVGHAFHSPLMEPMLDAFREVAASLTYTEPAIGLVSNLTGELARPGELTDPEYWVRHVRHAVRFNDGLVWLRAQGVNTFLELGPDGTLSALAQGDPEDDPEDDPAAERAAKSAAVSGVAPAADRIVSAPLLRPDRPEAHTLLTALARIHVHGVAVDWSAVIGPGPAGTVGRRRVELPTYAFDRRRYWPRTHGQVADLSAVGLSAADHPLLGSAVELAGSQELLFTGRLSLRTHPWLADHAIFDTVLLPGTAILELALRAGDEAGYDSVEELALQVPLVLPERGSVVLQLLLGAPTPDGRRPFTLSSRHDDAHVAADQTWTCHATGALTRGGDPLGGAAGPAEGGVAEHEAADHEMAHETTEAWPPPDAVPVDLTTWYVDLAGVGLGYGPAFQGLRAAWRRGDEFFAEVALDEERAADAARYALHPALLDAALHPVALGLDTAPGPDSQELGRLPFSWGGVTVGLVGASALRVRLTPVAQDTIALRATDGSGRLVVQARSLAFRPVTAERLRAAGTAYHEALFRLEWTPRSVAPTAPVSRRRWALVGPEVPGLAGALDEAGAEWRTYPHLAAVGEAVSRGDLSPDMVVFSCRAQEPGRQDPPGDHLDPILPTTATDSSTVTPEALRQAANGTLELLLSWLDDERFVDCRLALVTHGAVAATPADGVPDLTCAPVWGLVRSAQSEHPDRFVLADIDGRPGSQRALPEALLAGEPQFALRDGTVHLPRVGRVAVAVPPADHPEDHPTDREDVRTAAEAVAPRTWDPDGTVLITGGTGVLGRMVARHLVTAHGVRHLLLTGRRGPAADGVPELVAELTRLGADATVRACDTADRHAVAELLSGIPVRHPLRAVIHLAGVVDDGILTSLTAERMDAVLGPKAIGALHLHELTRDAGLDAFVVFSSAAASFGSPGQGNYTAANAFLDALMRHRRALDLPGQSLAWGMWARDSGMTGRLGATDRARMARGGLAPLTDEQGLALLDAAGTVDEAVLLATPLDFRALRAQAAAGGLPAILRGLVRAPARRAATATSATDATATTSGETPAALRERLAALPGGTERTGALLELVRTHAAAVLGHDAAETIDAGEEFRELGFDSLTAVELRNRLSAVTGLRLATTLVFDHPSPGALARHMGERLDIEADAAAARPTPRHVPGPTHREGPSADTVESLFWVGHDTGRIHEAMHLLSAASVFRPSFRVGSGEVAPKFVRLAQVAAEDATSGGEAAEHTPPVLICLPTVAAISSAYQYSRFASALQGLRDVWYAPAPGFLVGELLPADVDAVTHLFAEAVLRFTEGAPFALAGHSAGGWLTYSVTSHLESLGVRPEAVVAMDAYLPDEGIAPVASALTSEIFDRVTEFVEVDYTRLTAMGGYFRIFSGWTPPQIDTPALFIRGRDGEQSPPVWGVPHTVMDVAGDHFTMLEEHAGATARHVDQWLRETAGWGG